MELWDAYDENRKPLGYTVKREKFDLLNNEYHIVVHIWIKNSKGEYLIQKRSSNKKEGLKWAWTGGSVLMGENSIDGAVREVKKELGLTVDKEKLTLFTSYKRELYKDFVDVYIYKNDIDVSKLTLQKDEVCDVKWATKDEISKMILSGEFISTNNSQYVNEILI